MIGQISDLEQGASVRSKLNATIDQTNELGDPTGKITAPTLVDEVVAIEVRVDTAEADIDALQGRATALESDVAILGEQVAILEGAVGGQANDIADLEVRVGATEAKNVEQDGRLTAGEAKDVEQDDRLTTTEGNVTTLQAQVQQVQSDLVLLDGRVDLAEAGIIDLEADVAGHETRISALEISDTEQDSAIAGLEAAVAGGVGNVFLIAADTTLNVATTGSDSTGTGALGAEFATIPGALDYLENKIFAHGVRIMISVAAGDYVHNRCCMATHPQSNQISIEGAELTGSAITGINHADFTNPNAPVAPTRGEWELYNTAGHLPVLANPDREAAMISDMANNIELLKLRFPTRITLTDSATGFYLRNGLATLTRFLLIQTTTSFIGGTPELEGKAIYASGCSLVNTGNEMGYAGFGNGAIYCNMNAAIQCGTAYFTRCNNLLSVYLSRVNVNKIYATGTPTGIAITANGSTLFLPYLNMSAFTNIAVQLQDGTYGNFADVIATAITGNVFYLIRESQAMIGWGGTEVRIEGISTIALRLTDGSGLRMRQIAVVTFTLGVKDTVTAIKLIRDSWLVIDMPITVRFSASVVNCLDNSRVIFMGKVTCQTTGTAAMPHFSATVGGVIRFFNGMSLAVHNATNFEALTGGQIIDNTNSISVDSNAYPSGIVPRLNCQDKTRALVWSHPAAAVPTLVNLLPARPEMDDA